MSLMYFAEQELAQIGMGPDCEDELNVMMRDNILRMVKEFSDGGHSGASAAYALSVLTKLLDFKPLTPLTGEDWEWVELDYDPEMKAQNSRCSHVFKRADGTAYDSEGIIYFDIETDEDGKKYKSYYTCSESRVDITFPYTPHKKYMPRPE